MKVQELAALIGGILKIFTMMGFLIIRFFNMFLIDEILLESIKNDCSKKDDISKEVLVKFNEVGLKNNYLSKIETKKSNVDLVKRKVSSNQQDVDKFKITSLKKQEKIKEFENIESKSIFDSEIKISYFDIISFYFCCFISKFQRRKDEIKKAINQIRIHSDFSNVLNNLSNK